MGEGLVVRERPSGANSAIPAGHWVRRGGMVCVDYGGVVELGGGGSGSGTKAHPKEKESGEGWVEVEVEGGKMGDESEGW